ncbi:MAG: MFS transporter [Puniceicoccales bacterium]|jgi:nucleoside transporter|nr:MFS transporter [Puniceicoccales bacterium]
MSSPETPAGNAVAGTVAAVDAPPEKTPHTIFAALAAMFFLQLFVWGAWYVTIPLWLAKTTLPADFTAWVAGAFPFVAGLPAWLNAALTNLYTWVYTVCPLSAIISPLFLGMVADRFFAPHKVYAVLHLIGAGFALAVLALISNAGAGDTWLAPVFVLLLLGHALCYMPTLALANTVAFQHVRRLETEFPIIRVFGTFGWIAAGLVVGMPLFGEGFTVAQFQVVAGAAVILGVFAFFLPKTVPPLKGKQTNIKELLGVEAVSLLKDRNFAVFMLCSLLITVSLAGYFSSAAEFVNYAKFDNPAATMTLGQVSEVFFMLAMPLFFARLGIKKMLVISMAMWLLRYGVFATAADGGVKWLVILGLLMHGICYDFFFVAGFIYVDRAAARVRAQAQAFFVLITQGVGMIIGMHLCGAIKTANTTVTTVAAQAATATSPAVPATTVTTVAWAATWLPLAGMALVATVLFALFFKEHEPRRGGIA